MIVEEVQSCVLTWRAGTDGTVPGFWVRHMILDTTHQENVPSVPRSPLSNRRFEMNDQQTTEQCSGVRDQEIRAALDRHWTASDANDFETEHLIYHEDAVLEYPQSGERTRGRSNVQNQRA